MTKRKVKNATDFLAELNADPDHVARRRAQEDVRLLRDAEVKTVTQPLLDQLAATGYQAASLEAVVSLYAPLPHPVVALLLEWLPKVKDTAVQEQIVRALGASAVPFEGDALVMLFRSTASDALRYAIANTMAQAPVQGVGSWALQAVQNADLGTSQQMLALAVARHNPATVANPVLVSLLGRMPGHAALALAETGGQPELAALEAGYARTNGWERQEIGRAMSVIRRRLVESR